jgi:hypothetical protein
MRRKRVLPFCLGALFVAVPAMSQKKTSITLEDLVRAPLARDRGVLALRQRVAQAQGLASDRPFGSVGEEQFSATFVQPVETFGKRKRRLNVAEISVLDRVSESLRESQRLTDARVREEDAAPLEAQLLAVEQSRADAQRADATGRLIAPELEIRRLIGLAPTDALPTIGPPTGGKAALLLEELILPRKRKAG